MQIRIPQPDKVVGVDVIEVPDGGRRGRRGPPGPGTKTRLVTGPTVLALTAADTGLTIIADSSAGAVAVTLPPAADNLSFTFKNTSTFFTIVTPSAPSETIDGLASVPLVAPSGATFATPSSVTVVSQGGKWWIVARA